MIAAALPGVMSLVQTLMGADAPVAADPPSATAGADFAMMMAGLATPAPPAAADDAAEADPAEDAARGKAPRDDDDDAQPAQPQDAALLAMLAPMPQAPPPDAGSPKPPADVQAPATISPAARAAIAAAPPVAAGPAAEPAPADAGPKAPPAKAAAAGIAGAAPADAEPTAPVVKAVAAPALKPVAPGSDPAPAAIATVAAAILAESRPAGQKPVKESDVETADVAPVPAPPRPTDMATISTLAQALPGDPPRAAHATAAAPDAPASALGVALGEQRLSLAQGSGWLDQLARDIATTAGVEGKLHFRLNPEHLGSLHVEVTRGAEGAAVRLTADTPAARDILVDAQPLLVAEARAQGVRIAGTQVDVSDGGQTPSGDGRRAARGVTPQVRAIGAAGATIDTTKPRGAACERYA